MSVQLLRRALWFRRGVSLALVVVATFVVAAAAAGPLYLRSAGESLLQDSLRTAGADAAGIEATLLGTGIDRPGSQLADATRRALAGRRLHGAPIEAFEADDVARGPGGVVVAVRLASRQRVCEQVVLTGRCPGDAGEVVVSARLAKRLSLHSGGSLDLTSGGRMRVVGTYVPKDEQSAYWFGRTYFHPTGTFDDTTDTELGDAPFTVPETLAALPTTLAVRAVVDVPAELGRLRLSDASPAAADARAVTTEILESVGNVQVRSSLPDLLDAATQRARLLRGPVLLVVLQLLVLSWLVLFTVVANSVDARGPEVGLAKLRGLPSAATLRFGLLEPFALLLLAVPLGLLLALVTVGAVARTQFVGDVPVGLTPLALAGAAVAVVGGAVAAALAARSTLTRPALDLFRRTTARSTRRGWAADAAVLTLTAAGLVQLVVSGAVSGDKVDPVALLAPGLLALAAALLAARLLPALCRALAGPTRGRHHLGLFLAVRQVARRPAGARTVVVLVVAFALATFSVSAWSVARDNRRARAFTLTGAAQVLTITAPSGRDTAEAVRQADPAGHWAMAVTELDLLSSSNGGRKVLAVDSSRLGSVAFWRPDFATRPAASLARALQPGAAAPVRVRGRSLTIRMRTERLTVQGQPLTTAHLSVRLMDNRNLATTVDLGPLPSGVADLRGRVDCASGCRLAAFTLTKKTLAQVIGSFTIERVSDDAGPVDAGLGDGNRWRTLTSDDPPTLRADPTGLGVDVATSEFSSPSWGPADFPLPLPAIVTRSVLAGPGGEPQAVGLDQAPLDVHPVAVAAALPRAEADGIVVDRAYALRATNAAGSLGTETVWLGSSAPGDAVARLRAAGLTVTSTERAAEHEDALSREGPALALLLFLLGAGAAALLAAGGTVLDLYLLGRRRVAELSAVRALGVRRRALLSGLLLEQGLLIGTGALVGVAAGVGGALLALPSVPEFDEVPPAPPLLFRPSAALLAVLLAGILAVLAVAVLLAVVSLVRGAGPDRLREGPA